jgi:hypothetical protein
MKKPRESEHLLTASIYVRSEERQITVLCCPSTSFSPFHFTVLLPVRFVSNQDCN